MWLFGSKEALLMDCGLLGICKRGKKLSIWPEFCVWRLVLWWHFGNVGRAAQEACSLTWILGLTWYLLLDLGWQNLFSLLNHLWQSEGLCRGSSLLCTESVPFFNEERLECEIRPEVKDSCLNGVLNWVALVQTLVRCFAAISVTHMQQLPTKHWVFINWGNTWYILEISSFPLTLS
jgi:hypothetical protein